MHVFAKFWREEKEDCGVFEKSLLHLIPGNISDKNRASVTIRFWEIVYLALPLANILALVRSRAVSQKRIMIKRV